MSNTLTILQAPKVATITDQPIVVDELVAGTFGIYALSDIRISKTNRKRFNVVKLNELAASIKTKGVAQPILIRPVAPSNEEPQTYEIVAGERRFRASIIAGLQVIPAMCRNLTDQEALELQILENLQRDNPHPLEEAEGYEQLMLKHGYNADQLADKLNKSRSYVYGRLKLCALNLEVREIFLDNEDQLSASVALLIARIPVAKLQTKAANEILRPNGLQSDEPMSFRRAKQWIQDKYMLDLGRAVFPIKDARLLTEAGNCNSCPKRAGNQPVLYEGISPNVCTDPECFAEKTAAFYSRLATQAKKEGRPVHEGEEARKLYSEIYRYGSDLVTGDSPLYTFERVTPGTGMAGNVKTHLKVEQLPPVVAYIKEANGALLYLYQRAAVQEAFEKHGVCESLAAREPHQAIENAAASSDDDNHDVDQGDDDDDEPRRSLNEKAKAITKERVALYRRLRPMIAGVMPLTIMREMTKLLIRDFPLPDDLIGDLYPFEDRSDEGVCAYIDTAEYDQVQQILFDLIIGEHLSVDRWDVDDAEESNAHAALQAMAAEPPQEAEEQVRLNNAPPGEPEAVEHPPAPARTVLKLKSNDTSDTKEPSDGPIIRVKKTRIVPAEAWPFPIPNTTKA